MPTTLRIAVLAGLLALRSNLAVIGCIYFRTHDEAVATIHQQVAEQAKVLSDMYRSGGEAAVDDGVGETVSYGDTQSVAALITADMHQAAGNFETHPATVLPRQEGYHN